MNWTDKPVLDKLVEIGVIDDRFLKSGGRISESAEYIISPWYQLQKALLRDAIVRLLHREGARLLYCEKLGIWEITDKFGDWMLEDGTFSDENADHWPTYDEAIIAAMLATL